MLNCILFESGLNLNDVIENRLPLIGTELKKLLQKKRILNLLYRHDSMSGTAIASRMGVSLPTALAILNELVEMRFVESCGTGISRGGRKPILFRLLNNSMYVIACELSRYQWRIVIYDAHNQPVTSIYTFDTCIDDNDLDEKIYSNSQELIQKYKIDENHIFAIGLTMPGLVDEIIGINYTIKNIEFQNIRERLEEKFKNFVYVNNDARMQAYGEYIFGKAKGHSNAIIIYWSWGIGVGIILDGKLYNGSTGFAGELSHAKFVEDGDLCGCGKRGCLETVASSDFWLKMLLRELKSEHIINSLFGQVSLSYKNYLYLDVTGRNDWSSTLGENNRSYFYPSVTGAFLANQIFDPEADLFNLLKIRASWANVGNDTAPYQLNSYYDVASDGYLGLTQLSRPSVKFNPDLKPENIASMEFGLEGSMLDNRLFFDLSLYNIKTTDQIYDVPVPASTGYSTFRENIGEMTNKGIELLVGGIPVKTDNFSWQVSTNFSRNKNELVELIEDIESHILNSTNSGNLNIHATVGGGYGDIYGTTWRTNDAGQLVVDANGRPQASADKSYLGNSQPD